jgi:hypothetical protein
MGFTTLLAGGGAKRGVVEGATDEVGYKAVENPHYVTDLQATILQHLGLNYKKMDFVLNGRPFQLIEEGSHTAWCRSVTRMMGCVGAPFELLSSIDFQHAAGRVPVHQHGSERKLKADQGGTQPVALQRTWADARETTTSVITWNAPTDGGTGGRQKKTLGEKKRDQVPLAAPRATRIANSRERWRARTRLRLAICAHAIVIRASFERGEQPNFGERR